MAKTLSEMLDAEHLRYVRLLKVIGLLLDLGYADVLESVFREVDNEIADALG